MKDHNFGIPLSDLFARETQANTSRAESLRPPSIATIATLYQPGMMLLIGAALVATAPWITRSLGGSDIPAGFQHVFETAGFWAGPIFAGFGLASLLRTTFTLERGRNELRKDAELRQRVYNRLRYAKSEDGREFVFDPLTGKDAKPTYVGIQMLVKNLRNFE